MNRNLEKPGQRIKPVPAFSECVTVKIIPPAMQGEESSLDERTPMLE